MRLRCAYLLLMLLTTTTLSKSPLRVLTHNIRYAATDLDGQERPWPERKQHLINELKFNTFGTDSLIFLQEALDGQLGDVMSGINSGPHEWDYIGVGRDNGQRKGEYSPILYRPAVWKLKKFETIWMSTTPSVPSKGWDAGSIRILTVGLFERDGRLFLILNTHLDNQGTVSRFESAKLILKTIKSYISSNPIHAVIFGGDLNSQQNQEAYQTLTSSDSPLTDCAQLAANRYGDIHTFTGFENNPDDLVVLDYTMVGPKNVLDSVTVPNYGVLPNRFEDGIYLSDHRAVVVDMLI
ncbi:endonuclease/exonuclease/phosphatase family protein [Ramicandelaber brevisporus]|nr:endonuclease/exonuclease/phosphatase family protein [Ramicandelaber brevisporus]